MNFENNVPREVSYVTQRLEEAGFEAFLVGGCVRDLVINEMLHQKQVTPKDWDITTNAVPEEIIPLFEKTIYENNFGTVGVCVPVHSSPEEDIPLQDQKVTHETLNNVSHETFNSDVTHETLKNQNYNVSQITPEGVVYTLVEVTPYRTEATYSDFRHPDEVKFSKNLEDDLKRRDFTVNAMVLDSKGHLTDMFQGIEDIKTKTLRTVGGPDERFSEDALRMLRAVRFACQLGFSIATETTESIMSHAELVKRISSERIRDEFIKILMSPTPAMGVVMLQKFGLLKYIIPELEEGIGCKQGGAHKYDVWNHLLMALQHAADKNWPLEIRIAALFHDIGKPRTRRNMWSVRLPHSSLSSDEAKQDILEESYAVKSTKKQYTFYGHEVVGARMAQKIMDRLKFSRKETDLVETLVRTHMFFSDTEKITLSAVRRIITKVGKENIWLLMNIRECDRVGMNKTEAPYRLRKYFAMIEEALRDPISVKQLKINGDYLMNVLHMKPGPRMGWTLNALLEEVLEDSTKNTVEYLSDRVGELDKLDDQTLRNLGEQGKEKKDELEEAEIGKLHVKHGVHHKA